MKYYFASFHNNDGDIAYDTKPIPESQGEYFEEVDITEPYFLIDTDDEHVSVSYQGQSPEDIYNQKKEAFMNDYGVDEEGLEEEAPELVSFDAWKEWVESTYVDNDSWSAVGVIETETMTPVIAGNLNLFQSYEGEEYEDEEEFEEESSLEESLKEIARDLNKLVEQLKRK